MSSSRLDRFFKDYSSFHRTGGNQLCHLFGIPLIVVSLLGLLAGWVWPGTDAGALARLDGGILLLALALVWYLFLDWGLALEFAFFGLGLYCIGRALPLEALWTLQLAGWALQFVGHYHYERKSPAFFKNVQHLLVGPLWVFAKMTRYRQESSRRP